MPKKISDLTINNTPSASDVIPYSNGVDATDRGLNVSYFDNKITEVRNGIPILNASWLGIIGDGATDNTTALKSAISSAGDILAIGFDEGTYNFSTFTDTAITKDIFFVGLGDKEKIILSADYGGVNDGGRFSVKGNLYLDNITFKDWNIGHSTRWLFEIDGGNFISGAASTKNVIVKDCIFDNMIGAVGKRYQDSGTNVSLDIVHISGCVFKNMGTYGFWIDTPCKFARIENNLFDKIGHEANMYGVDTTTTLSWAAGIGGNSTGDSVEYVHTMGNHFIDIVGAAGSENHAILHFGKNIITTNNVVDGVYAWVDDPDNPGTDIRGPATDTEAVYYKCINSITSNNYIKGAAGGNDAIFTVKSEEISEKNIVSNNIIIVDDPKAISEEKAVRISSSGIIEGNFIRGRVNLISMTTVDESNRYYILSNNNIDGFISLSTGSGQQHVSVRIENNTIRNQSTTNGAIRNSNATDRALIITGNKIYTQCSILDNVKGLDTLNFSNNVCFVSEYHRAFLLASGTRTLLFNRNEISVNEEQDTTLTFEPYHILTAVDYLEFSENIINLSGRSQLDRFEFRVQGSHEGVLRIINNKFSWNNPTGFDYTSGNALFETRLQVRLLEIKGNYFYNLAFISKPLIFLLRGDRGAVHELVIQDNQINSLERLINLHATALSLPRVGVIKVQNNAFNGGFVRIDNSVTGAPNFPGHILQQIENNRGWLTETNGENSVATGANIAHGLPTLAPTFVTATPKDAAAPDLYVSDIGTTNFKPNFTGGGTVAFMWMARWTPTAPTTPTAVTLTSPADLATGVSITPTLEIDEQEEGCLYRLQIATNDTFANLVFDREIICLMDSSGSTAQFDLSKLNITLSNNTQYYWRVKPIAGIEGSYTSARSFTTVA